MGTICEPSAASNKHSPDPEEEKKPVDNFPAAGASAHPESPAALRSVSRGSPAHSFNHASNLLRGQSFSPARQRFFGHNRGAGVEVQGN
jgi:hypothetical protein